MTSNKKTEPGGSTQRAWIAVDLGAGSGRVVLGRLSDAGLSLQVVHRFESPARQLDGHLRWDFEQLWNAIQTGLQRVAQQTRIDSGALSSLGVDSWGVDYGLIDARGRLLADPVAYRDARTAGALERLFRLIPPSELYRRTGIQHMPINTIVQLFTQIEAGEWPHGADRLLMIPDLVHARLCGSASCERTNASTTQMLSLDGRGWDLDLARTIGLDPGVLPPLVDAPRHLGELRTELCAALSLPHLPVVAPATHDTASAVAGTPLASGWAFLSSGTWSLVGIETARPNASSVAAAANLSNELALGGRTRLLKNVMGLWILESCRAAWRRGGHAPSHDELLAELDGTVPGRVFIDPDDPRFLAPADMDAEVRAYLEQAGGKAEAQADACELARIVLVSLALRYAEVLDELSRASAAPIQGLHVVGGGSRNAFLNQATANACGLPVRAGPVEATAFGNLLVQAVADGSFADLDSARACLASSVPLREFEPRVTAAWQEARDRFANHRSSRA